LDFDNDMSTFFVASTTGQAKSERRIAACALHSKDFCPVEQGTDKMTVPAAGESEV
jgi:hypothetical protein